MEQFSGEGCSNERPMTLNGVWGAFVLLSVMPVADLVLGLQDRGLVPVIGRHGHAPNVPWFIQFDPAVQRVLRIDIDNPSRSTLIRQVDVNRDSHPTAQPNCGCDQCSVKVDDDSLAFARQSLSASTSSRRVKRCNWVR